MFVTSEKFSPPFSQCELSQCELSQYALNQCELSRCAMNQCELSQCVLRPDMTMSSTRDVKLKELKELYHNLRYLKYFLAAPSGAVL